MRKIKKIREIREIRNNTFFCIFENENTETILVLRDQESRLWATGYEALTCVSNCAAGRSSAAAPNCRINAASRTLACPGCILFNEKQNTPHCTVIYR